ncbi:MAG: hypothetical protein ABJQ39_13200 [Winogradskyella arenosi]
MKTLVVLFVTLFALHAPPNLEVVNSISLADHYKIEGTFSGNTEGENSFHLIIAKNTNTKNFEIIPYLYQEEEIIKLKAVTFEKLPSVLSFHNNDDILSLVTQSKVGRDEMINVVDLNLSSGAFSISEAIDTDDFKTLIRKKDKNIMVFSDKEEVKIIDVQGAETMNTITVKADASSADFLKALSNSNLDAINNDEFVANGSISTFRAYSDGASVLITEENTKEALTNVVQIPLEGDSEQTAKTLIFGGEKPDLKIKKSTSYVNNDKLYQLQLGKEVAVLDVFGIDSYFKSSTDLMNVKPSGSADNFESTKAFTKQAAKKVNEPTVTINATKDNKLKVRFDFVNKNTYNYRYDWWWHHHWQMQQMQLMMQQNMRHSVPSFGPAAVSDYYYVGENKSYFEITIDASGGVVDGASSETLYQEIDKKAHIKALEENKKLKHTSTVFTKTTFRYLAYNKKTDVFTFVNKAL